MCLFPSSICRLSCCDASSPCSRRLMLPRMGLQWSWLKASWWCVSYRRSLCVCSTLIKRLQECTAGNLKIKNVALSHGLNVASSVCVYLCAFTLLAHLPPSFPPPCVHLGGHLSPCSCCSVQSGEGGISLRQMVDDVAPILLAESGRCCVLSTPHLNLPPLVHMSLSPGSSPISGQIPQAINPQNHNIVSADIFSMAWPSRNQTTETLAVFRAEDC